jgi:hypothetical protein
VEAGRFCLHPCLPSAWTELRLHFKLRGKNVQVLMHRRPQVAGVDHGSATDEIPTLQVAAKQWIAFDELPTESRLTLDLSSELAQPVNPLDPANGPPG